MNRKEAGVHPHVAVADQSGQMLGSRITGIFIAKFRYFEDAAAWCIPLFLLRARTEAAADGAPTF